MLNDSHLLTRFAVCACALGLSLFAAACGGDISGGGGSGGGSDATTGSTTAASTTTAAGTTTSAASTGTGVSAGDTCYQPKYFICTAMGLTADQCTQEGGTFGATCPSDSLLGCCFVQAGGFVGRNCYYQGGAVDALAGKKNCQAQNGTWSTTP